MTPPSTHRLSRGTYSLVLGAGGRPGLSYHAGTLLALELHGLAAAAATSVTGTSAGSIATALLATGATVEDLAAYSVGAPPRAQFRAVDELIRAADRRRPQVELGALRELLDPRRPLRAAGHLLARRASDALAALVPGVLAITRRFDFFDTMADSDVEVPPWRIVAADLTGSRHVLTAGQAPLSLAVAASCAVPGLFAAVRHDGIRLVDGGVHSTTNADLAADDPSDGVIVLAPMCARTPGRGRAPSRADVALADELASLQRAGKPVVTFRPSDELRQLMGRNPLSGRHSAAITAAAFLEAADVLPEVEPARRRATSPAA